MSNVTKKTATAKPANSREGKRIGGRGCPSCGSHDTEGLIARGVQWCNTCNHRWVPCKPHCRGYDIDVTGDTPKIIGCKDCGVPDKIAKWWPEAWRAVYKKLGEGDQKFSPVGPS